MDNNGKLQLLEKAQTGDRDAVTNLFRQCKDDVYFYAFQLLENEGNAKKAARDTLFMMCKEESVPATVEDFTPWMLYICHGCCKSYLPAGRKTEMPQPVSAPETDYVAVDAESNGVLPADARDRLMAGLQVLSMEERAMMVLLYYENFPLNTAAQIMGLHPAVAEAFRSQALRALKAAVMAGATPGKMGGCGMKNTLWWIFSALHKNVKCPALPIYKDLCAAMSITPTEEALREIEGIHTVKQPVKEQQLKMSLKERMEWWPKSLKIGLASVLALVLLGGGGYLAVTLMNNADNGLETSEVSVTDEFLDNLEKKFAEVSDADKTTKKKTTTTAKIKDANGNRIENGTTRATTTGKVRKKTNGGGNGGYVGGYEEENPNTPNVSHGNLHRTTTRRKVNGGGNGGNSAGSGGNGGNGGGGGGSNAQRPVPDNGGAGYAAFRPAIPTSDQGSKQTGGQTDGNFKYALYSNGTAHVTGFTGSGSVSVPSTLGGYTVTGIDPGAFKGMGISSVTLPSSVEVVSDNAFQDCHALRSASLPGVVSIGMYCFDGCSALSSVSVSTALKRIGSSAFKECTALSSFNIPTSVISIEAMAFNGCSALTSAKIPVGVSLIEDNVFRNCSSLSSVTIPASVSQIGNGAFYNCNSLKTVYYGGSQAQWARLPFDEVLNRPLTTANIVY
ncbi:MAG: leucine-rich repeat protein [Clostridia bacterium]|nr:leucine-rich repeat protein [Clostridia bacterium]